jgi:DNA uptake protein ComE-like DNA-binding protein
MRIAIVVTILLVSSLVEAKATLQSTDETPGSVRVLGRLNLNEATREQLETIPGLDPRAVDAIVAQRQKGAIRDLSALALSPEALSHLKTSGESDYRRIRQLPLQMIEIVRTARR